MDKNGIAISISRQFSLVHLLFRMGTKEIFVLTDGRCFEKAGRLLFEVDAAQDAFQ